MSNKFNEKELSLDSVGEKCLEAMEKNFPVAGRDWSSLMLLLPPWQAFEKEEPVKSAQDKGARIFHYIHLRRPFVLNLPALFELLQNHPELMEKVGSYLDIEDDS